MAADNIDESETDMFQLARETLPQPTLLLLQSQKIPGPGISFYRTQQWNELTFVGKRQNHVLTSGGGGQRKNKVHGGKVNVADEDKFLPHALRGIKQDPNLLACLLALSLLF